MAGAAWALLLLCMSLSKATGWMSVSVPGSHARDTILQRVVGQPAAVRHVVAPQMCSDSLSAEFGKLAVPRSTISFGSPLDMLRQHKADSAYVLIFNRGQDDESVFTLQGRETDSSSAGMHVLAFEGREAASRYAMLLAAQGFDKPAATLWESDPLTDFCWRAEFGLGYVPHDALLVPPQRANFDAAAVARLQEAAFAKQQNQMGGVRHWSQQEAEPGWSAGGPTVRTRVDRLVFDI